MSRRGNCACKQARLRWDNAVVERFFGTLKQELVNRCQFATREAARKEIFAYIEIWYNRQRRHSSLGYVSPSEFGRRAPQPSTSA
jgi:transposase InsO family protein